MKYLKRTLFALGSLLGGVVFYLANAAITGAVIAATERLGYWAYPTFFGINILLVVLAFFLYWLCNTWFVDPKNQGNVTLFGRAVGWLRKRFARAMTVDEKKLEKGIWPWVRRRGPFVLVLVCTFFPGPFFAGILIKFLGLPTQKAWTYAIICTLISTFLSISLYLGLLDGIRSFISSLY